LRSPTCSGHPMIVTTPIWRWLQALPRRTQCSRSLAPLTSRPRRLSARQVLVTSDVSRHFRSSRRRKCCRKRLNGSWQQSLHSRPNVLDDHATSSTDPVALLGAVCQFCFRSMPVNRWRSNWRTTTQPKVVCQCRDFLIAGSRVASVFLDRQLPCRHASHIVVPLLVTSCHNVYQGLSRRATESHLQLAAAHGHGISKRSASVNSC
jgi:hypothetical protein